MDTKTTAPTFDKKRVYKRMIVLCWCILIFWFFVKLLGGEGIEIVVNSQRFIDFMAFVDDSIIVKWIIGGLSNITITFLLWLTMIGKKWFRSNSQALILGSFLFIATGIEIFVPISFIVFDLTTLILIPIVVLKSSVVSMIISNIILVFTQALPIFTKNLMFDQFVSNSALQIAIFMVDVFIVMLLFYSYRLEVIKWDTGGRYGLAKTANNFKLCVTNVLLNVLKSMQRLRKSIKRLPNLMRNKIDRELFARKFLSYVFIFANICLFAYFTHSLANSIILFVCYISLRYLFPTTFHTTPLRCMMLSVTLFCIVLGNVLPLNTSLLSGVFCAFAFDWCLWRWQEHQDLLCRYDADFTKYGLSAEMAKFAHDWKVEGLRDKELMIKYEISSVNTLNSRKRRIKQAMHTK